LPSTSLEAEDRATASGHPADLWDLEHLVQRPLELTVHARRRWLGAEQWEFALTSQVHRGATVRIAGRVAVPRGRRPRPAVVLGHGDMGEVRRFARRHRVVCAAFDRPGVGASTGPEDTYENWITFEDPRESWLYVYVTAALRVLTYVAALPAVDPAALALTGYSRGGTMAWIANGVDRRLRLCVPRGTGGDIVGALEHGGWASYLHRREDGTPYVPEAFYAFARVYDPLVYADRQQASVLLMVGAQDEFFPLACTRSTAEAMPEPFRLQLIPNWDHHYFTASHPELEVYDNRRQSEGRQRRSMAAAIQRCLHRREDLPPFPAIRLEAATGGVLLAAGAAEGARRAMAWLSCDGAYTFVPATMERAGDEFVAALPLTAAEQERLALFVEVEYRDGLLLTSLPHLGPGFRQRMRPFPAPEGG